MAITRLKPTGVNSTASFTFANLTTTGNITASNANLGNLITGNYFSGNGSLLTSVSASTASTVTANAQPNITSVGTLVSITHSANSNITLSGSLSQVSGANLISATYVTGTLTTASQPNITTVGSLNGATVSGTLSLQQSTEVIASPSGATYDYSTGAVFYTTSATLGANFTPNFTNVPTTDNRITVVTIIINQGATPYMPTATTNIQIAGTNYTVKWASGSTPTGQASSIQYVSYNLIRTGAAWIVNGQAGYYA